MINSRFCSILTRNTKRMPHDYAIIAHGDVLRLLGSLLGGLALIVVAIVNGLIAIPFGSLIGWATFRARRKRVRIAIGLVATLTIFVGLWIVELSVLINVVNFQTT